MCKDHHKEQKLNQTIKIRNISLKFDIQYENRQNSTNNRHDK